MSRHRGAARDGLSTLQGVLAALLLAQFVMTFAVQGDRIPSASMEPTLRVGDFVMVNKLRYMGAGGHRWSAWLHPLLPPSAVRRGDLIVFHFPPDPQRFLVKRVVALGGDRLQLRDGRVLIDGAPVAEPYAYFDPGPADVYRDDFPDLHDTAPELDPAWWAQLHRLTADGELLVPKGMYFTLGDNRNNSEDSRYWGFVPQANIVGQPAFVYFNVLPAGDSEDLSPWRRLRAGVHAAHTLR